MRFRISVFPFFRTSAVHLLSLLLLAAGMVNLMADDSFSAQLVQEPDGRHFLTFPTVRGQFYTIEQSQDGTAFTPAPGGFYYGTGEELRYCFLHGQPPPPPPQPPGGTPPPNWGNPQTKPAYFVSADLYFSAIGGWGAAVDRADTTATPDHWRKLLEGTFPPTPAGQSRLLGFSVEDPDARYDFLLNLLHVPAEQFPGDLSGAPQLPRHLREAQLLEENLPRIVGELTRPAGTAASQALTSAKLLLRVRRQQIDTNGNGLFDDFELANEFSAFAVEGQSGYAAPSADPDHDGLTNAQEQARGTNPHNSDTDFDGSPDGEEVREGTNPNSNNSYPPRFILTDNALSYDFAVLQGTSTNTDPSPGNTGHLRMRDHWGDDININESLDAPLAFSGLSSRLEQSVPLPPTPPAAALPTWDLVKLGEASVKLESPANSEGQVLLAKATLGHGAVWLQVAPAATKPIVRPVLRITERLSDKQPEPVITTEVLSATIDPDSTHSNRIELLPSFLSHDLLPEGYWEKVTVRLLPVEVKTETIADQPANRDRKKIGIGEEVLLDLTSPADAQVTWALKSGSHGQLIRPLGYPANAIMFVASEQEKKAEIEATLTNYQNAKAVVSFDVITPKTITLEKTAPPQGFNYDPSGITVDPNVGQGGIRMEFHAKWYFGPDDVCFYNLQGGETAADPVLTKWFTLDPWYSQRKHPEWIGGPPDGHGNLTKKVVQGKGTEGEVPDHIQLGAWQPPTFDQQDPNKRGGRFVTD
ncbi:MAG: hypothetical protein KA004_16445 [Verrucomicrobiales bacterium]|nr:hypothetical protein [Verrucomicrobiales bacterium]